MDFSPDGSVLHDTCSDTHLIHIVERLAAVESRNAELERRIDTLLSKQDEVDADTNAPRLGKDLAPSGRLAVSCYLGIMGVSLLMAFIMADLLTPNHPLNQYIYGPVGRQTTCMPATKKGEGWEDWWTLGTDNESQRILKESGHIYIEAAVVGSFRSYAIQSAILTMVGFLCISLAALVPTLVVSLCPEEVPRDFEFKGTLSNLSQNVACPHGRVFTTMLFTGSLLMLLSGYPKFIYMSWFPMARTKYDIQFFVYQHQTEKIARNAWATVPNVGLMLTAALPSLTDNRGLKQILTIIHTVAAPCSLIILSIMEGFQLSYGENAFEYFLCSNESSGWNGPLTWSQRLRVILVCYLWVIVFLFFSMQVYLYLQYTGIKIKTSYTFALSSLYAEITALLLAYGLPAVQAALFLAINLSFKTEGAGSVFATAASLQTLPPPGKFMTGDVTSAMLQLVNVSHPSTRAIHPKVAKHLRAGADGLPYF